MIIARWQIDAKFGHKEQVIDSLKYWNREIGSQLGWEDVRMSTGSVGARECTCVVETELKDLAELNRAWEKLGKIEAHKQWSKELEPYVVNGSHKWEIFRVIE